ncbi:MAG: beta-galactosidase, partial [Armatimonadetes bacterium]|nr:beta-galactosidase [Armatimonadota bacterium]
MAVNRAAGGILATAGMVLVLASPGFGEWSVAFAPNPSFELDANRDGLPDGWRPATFRSPAKTAWDRQAAHTGHASVRVSDSKTPGDDAWDKNAGRWTTAGERPCVGGRTYSLRGWIKTDLTEGRARLAMAWFHRGKWLHEDTTKPVSGRTDWTEYTVTAQAPPTADSVRIFLMLSGGVGTAWFDDVAMVEGTEFPGNYRPVDLRAVANAGFADEQAGDGRGGWTDQGPNDAREIPLGRQVFRGVPFEIIGPAHNDGRACVVLRGRAWPKKPAAIEFTVGEKCDVLYFLHAGAWLGKAGQRVATYVITYSDGRTVSVPIRAGHEEVDWWRPRDTKESAVGWEGKNAETDHLGLSLFPWRNPRPEVTVEKVRAEASGKGQLLLVAVTAGDGPPVLQERPIKYEFTDTKGWYKWAFALHDPTLREIDLSFLLDAPAGKHGFLQVGKDGHFYFADGTPARFFGTDICSRRCMPDKKDAPIIAERLARYGVNLLRLHAIDSRWAGLIDYSSGGSRKFNPEALDRYDFFVAELLKRGIYVYFDLLDYRQFMLADGVRDADQLGTHWENSLKAASIFDPRMIELQKEYATALLTHKNPYTGRRYVDEPGLAVQEITNENSLFYLSNTRLMLPSYVEELKARWNKWLKAKYGGREGLIRAWASKGGDTALLEDEDPAAGTVRLPLQDLYADLSLRPAGAERNPARLNAMTRFLYELEIAYYDQMIGHLRSLGLKCPISGTNQDFSDASNFANAYCDFTSRNNYWNHPNLHAKPFPRFRNTPAVKSNLVMTANPIANVCSSSVAGKPIIVPEFNFPFPNEYRAEALPLMAAYARLQGWDGLLYFAYDPDAEPLSYFGNQSDPVRWGQVPMAALLFLRGDVAPARNTIDIGVSRVDAFATRRRRTDDRYSPYRVLPYISRVRNVYFDRTYQGDADVVIASGHSAFGDYSHARHAIIFADWPYTDEAARQRDRGASARATVPGLRTIDLAEPLKTALGTFDTALDPASLPKGAESIKAGGRTVGFVSDRWLIMPCASALG